MEEEGRKRQKKYGIRKEDWDGGRRLERCSGEKKKRRGGIKKGMGEGRIEGREEKREKEERRGRRLAWKT